MIDAAALEFLRGDTRFEPAAAAMGDESTPGFRLARAQETAAAQAAFGWILKLQYRAIVPLRHLLHGRQRARIMQVAENDDNSSARQRRTDLREASPDDGRFVIAKAPHAVQPLPYLFGRQARLDAHIAAAQSDQPNWTHAIEARERQAAGD